jgi:hypothetical protein
MTGWSNGGRMAEWLNGRMVEWQRWQNGGRNGGMAAKWRNGSRMAEWLNGGNGYSNGRNAYLPTILWYTPTATPTTTPFNLL